MTVPQATSPAPLPPPPSPAGAGRSYRQDPVFGWRWLRRRTLIFAACIAAVAALTGVGVSAGQRDPHAGMMAALHFFFGFLLMSSAGPLLATLVRHRGWPPRRERIGVVAAVLVGIVIAYFADAWASGHLRQAMPPGQAGQITPTPMTALVFALVATLKVIASMLVYGALGGGLALRAYFREERRAGEARQAQALAAMAARQQQADLRLGVLQAQVEPHFLFNTLASVRAQVRQDPVQAEATLDALVDYLRATIPRLRDGDGDAALHATLGQQLDLCASYLELMRLRTAGRLRYTVRADDRLRALPFPPMLLITLVENAVKHGIEPRPGPGTVTVVADGDGAQLCVRVIDDGLGLRPGVGGGLGLSNVRAQLETRYGARGSLRLHGGPDGGACAELRVPLESATGYAGGAVHADADGDARGPVGDNPPA